MIDIVNELKEYEIQSIIVDPQADKDEAYEEYGIEFIDIDEIRDVDAIILAVGHDDFVDMKQSDFDRLFSDIPYEKRVLVDVKGILSRQEYELAGYNYWRL